MSVGTGKGRSVSHGLREEEFVLWIQCSGGSGGDRRNTRERGWIEETHSIFVSPDVKEGAYLISVDPSRSIPFLH